MKSRLAAAPPAPGSSSTASSPTHDAPAPTPRPRRSPEQRFDIRFDKVFPVIVGSELYGDASGIARNLSAGGMMIEMADMLPLGSLVTIHFRASDGQSEIVARAEVKHHYCLNFASTGEPSGARGMGLRFIEFLEDSTLDVDSFTRSPLLH